MPTPSGLRRSLLAAALLFAGPAIARGDDPAPVTTPPPRPTTKPEITPEDVRERIKWLACEGLCGRESLEPGALAASQWVADEFARLRLEPAPLAGQKPGDEVLVRVLRDGKEVALKVKLGSL